MFVKMVQLSQSLPLGKLAQLDTCMCHRPVCVGLFGAQHKFLENFTLQHLENRFVCVG